MENVYHTLECDDFSEIEEIRRSYLRLVKKFHPDKATSGCGPETDRTRNSDCQNGQTFTNDDFIKIDKAWKILNDHDVKKRYDLVLKQRQLSQDWPIQDELNIDELDEEEDGNLSYVCRCGGCYSLNPDDVNFSLDFVCCDSCTLCVKIIYAN